MTSLTPLVQSKGMRLVCISYSEHQISSLFKRPLLVFSTRAYCFNCWSVGLLVIIRASTAPSTEHVIEWSSLWFGTFLQLAESHFTALICNLAICFLYEHPLFLGLWHWRVRDLTTIKNGPCKLTRGGGNQAHTISFCWFIHVISAF